MRRRVELVLVGGGGQVVGVGGKIAFFCMASGANMHHCRPPTNSR